MAEGSCEITTGFSLLRRQAQEDDKLKKLLALLQSPFKQNFATDAFLASLGTSLGISFLIFLIWCFLRPYHSLVYAPKLRHVDPKYAPPPVGKGYFSWMQPLRLKEADLVDRLGMDATIFLRFMRLCRNLFGVLGILGCLIMIPVNIHCNKEANSWGDKRWFVVLSPMYTWGRCMWAHVIVAYVFDFIIMYFLWTNYKHVVRLRKNYFESSDYVNSVHSRSLMVWDVPQSYRSDAGLNKIIGSLSVPMHGDEKCAIGRNVKILPELIERHSKAVCNLEEVLAKYLKNPDRLPAARPMCKPDKDDKSMPAGTVVDAIEYHKRRVEELERQIYTVRQSIDMRDAMQYGFVSYPTISRAHVAAKAVRGKHIKGTSIALATRSADIIWENFGRSKASRRRNAFIGGLLFVALSVFFVIPNALIAVFLSNLANISLVYEDFQGTLIRYHKEFAIVQGFAAPTVTSLIYLLLPIIMRRISSWQGDITKSERERHVVSKLYFFFVLNNLIIFTVFGQIWFIVQEFIGKAEGSNNVWLTIKDMDYAPRIAIAIFDVSSFWITYLLQRNLGAILDLAQVVSLIGKSFAVRFMSPTPRQKIEWTAPPPFDYATYYNYFLFYLTIALCFATIQPLVLPVAFLYFLIDSFLKKYTLMYIFITKVESGGTFWRVIFNRILFATGLFNGVVCLIVWTRYDRMTAASLAPLLLILIGFKLYCRNAFDMQARYHTKGSGRDSIIAVGHIKSNDSVGKRYSHPALHQKLLKPMVPAKAEHLMGQIFQSSSSTPGGPGIGMDNMQRGQVGKKIPTHGFEVVKEEDMDFEHFKHRSEFNADHGGGSVYNDGYSDRSGTPVPGYIGTPGSSRPGTPSRVPSPSPLTLGGYRGVDYVPLTGPPPPRSPGHRPFTPTSMHSSYDYGQTDAMSETGAHLLSHQQHPAGAPPGVYQAYQPYNQGYEDFRGPRR